MMSRDGVTLDEPSTPLVDELMEALLAADRLEVAAIYRRHRDPALPQAFADRLLCPALERIGAGWAAGNVALSQVYLAGRLCENLIEELHRPASDGPAARVGVAVLGDPHVLGKRLVASVLRSAGIPLLDFGRLEAAALVARVVAQPLDLLLISTLMLPSALRVREVVDGLRARGVATKVAVGGAPFRFDRELWREVGADAMGVSAADALVLARRFAGAPS